MTKVWIQLRATLLEPLFSVNCTSLEQMTIKRPGEWPLLVKKTKEKEKPILCRVILDRKRRNIWKQQHQQCDQIGRFLKVLGNRISSKRSRNDWQLFGLFWKISLWCKNCIGYFLGNFWQKMGYFFLQHLATLNTSHTSLAIILFRFWSEYFASLFEHHFHRGSVL